MKKLTFLLLFMVVLGTTVPSALSANNPKKPAKASSDKPDTRKAKFADFSVTLSKGANVSGIWVIEFSNSSGTYQFQFNNNSVTIPSGIYQVGIHPTGGASTYYTIAGSVCTYNYNVYGTSALFSSVPCTCGSGGFSVN
jgi:hypothetical protein